MTAEQPIWRTHGMTSSMSVEWATPLSLFRLLNREFNFKYDLCPMDGAAIAEPLLPLDDALRSSLWAPGHAVWMNPPYGRHIGDWLEKAYREASRGTSVVALIPARTDTSWWHDYCMRADEIRFLRGRLRFDGPKAGRCPFPSAIVIFRAKP